MTVHFESPYYSDSLDFASSWEVMEKKPDHSHVKFDIRVFSPDFVKKVPLFICPQVEALDFVGSKPSRSQLNIPQYTEPQELQEFKARIETMSNLKYLKITSFLVPNEIIHFQNASLTTLALDKVALSQETFESIASLINTCRTLFFVSFNCVEPENLTLADKSPLFAAINFNASIRKFNFITRNRVLNQNEMQGALDLIHQTKTLRNFSLIADHFEGEQFSCLFEALSMNISLLSFRAVSNISPEEDLLMDDPILLDTQPIHVFLAMNQTLRFLDMTQRFEILGKLSEEGIEEIKQSVIEHPGLLKFHLGSLQLSKSSLEGDIVHYSLINEASHLLKLGRLLTFSKRILGKQLAVELVDNILQQGTVDSIWPDSLWKPIRRAVMDRQTLGKLYSETRDFDAFELAYLCRSIDQ